MPCIADVQAQLQAAEVAAAAVREAEEAAAAACRLEAIAGMRLPMLSSNGSNLKLASKLYWCPGVVMQTSLLAEGPRLHVGVGTVSKVLHCKVPDHEHQDSMCCRPLRGGSHA